MPFHIDPNEGSEAIADLPDEQFQILVRIVMWELAMRTTPENFEGHLREIASLRESIEDDVQASRKARDHRRFVASVLQDIDRLPSTEESGQELTTGLYL